MNYGATQLLPKDEEAKELRIDPTVEPHARMQTTELNIDLQRGSKASSQEKNDLRFCRCPRALQQEFSLRLTYDNSKEFDHISESGKLKVYGA